MSENILCVDDNSNILAGYKRKLRKQFDIMIAYSGRQGLKMIETKGPFAIVVSDIRMPVMDGIQFMEQVRKLNPDSIRMILTGYADLETLIDAVNKGFIFKLLMKPCPTETFANALNEGMAQFRRIGTERKLQKETFLGSVNNLTEILRITRPQIYKKSLRLKQYVKHLVAKLNLENAWQYELAASLSLIGCICLPTTILQKVEKSSPLSAEEQNIFMVHPNLGAKFIRNIPRLETISEIIKRQIQEHNLQTPLLSLNFKETQNDIILGSEMLKVAFEYDKYRVNGHSHPQTITLLRKQRDFINHQLTELLIDGNFSD